MARRQRLSVVQLPTPLKTLSGLGEHHEYESFVLPESVDDAPFMHWTAHLRSFWGWYAEEPNYAALEEELPKLRAVISEGLAKAGWHDYSRAIALSSSNEEINRAIFSQYTAEGGLYGSVNELMRSAHSGGKIHGSPLAPWILQLNAAMRTLPTVDGPVFRGVRMSDEEIALYSPELLFEWAGFISTSRNRDIALDARGNVLFEIRPSGALTMYGKRNPYDIAPFSVFPDEQEAIFPMACTYRVLSVDKLPKSKTLIRIESVDFY